MYKSTGSSGGGGGMSGAAMAAMVKSDDLMLSEPEYDENVNLDYTGRHCQVRSRSRSRRIGSWVGRGREGGVLLVGAQQGK